MTETDKLTKEYMNDKAHFADLLNYKLYGGREVIKPDDLEEMDSKLLYNHISDWGFSDLSLERTKDVIKKCIVMHDSKAEYVIFNIENQTNIDLTMPLRNMVTDTLQYLKQLTELQKTHKQNNDLKKDEYISGISKTDRLNPVITFTVYWGADKWNGARNLHEMLALDEENVLKYLNNYDINLIEPASIENFDTFSTDLGAVFEYINVSENKEKLMNLIDSNSCLFSDMDELSVALINKTTGSNIRIDRNRTRNGGVNVCKALQEIIEDERKAIIAEKDNIINEKDNIIAEKDAKIAALEQQLSELKGF